MINLKLGLEHLAWSNQKFFKLFGQQPPEVFGLRAADGEWPVGKLLNHLAGSGEWYRYCLNGTQWTDLKRITTGAIALEYLPIIANLDQVLLDNLPLPDDILEIKDEKGTKQVPRSLILSQAVTHAAEHKGQIATIMKQHGFHIDLDALDLWSFLREAK